jgi:N-acetylmuramoyl-L-alanine amidase
LIETGFLSADADENYLMKKENQQEMASTILKAFSNYKKDVEDYQEPDISSGKEEKSTPPSAPVNDEAKPPSTVKGSLDVAYRIQIAASSKSTIDARYHNIDDLEVIKEGEMYKFLVGYFSSPEAARPRLSALKANGFEGAFIVAYKDGQRVRA